MEVYADNGKIPIIPTEQAFYHFSNMVFRLAVSRCGGRIADAEDVLSDVFFRYARHVEKHNNPFSSYEHQKAWLIKVTINCSKTLVSSAWNRHMTAELTDTDAYVENSTEYGEVYEAVLTLPVKYRTAVHLFYYEGYKIADMAKLLNVSENTVKSWLKRSRSILAEKLCEYEL